MNAISSNSYTPTFSSRCPQIRDAQWVCRTVKTLYPHVSSTHFNASVNKLKNNHFDLYQKYVKSLDYNSNQTPIKVDNLQDEKILKIFAWHTNLAKKIKAVRVQWQQKSSIPFVRTANILEQFKHAKVGNCGEEAILSQAILKLNGVKDPKIAILTLDGMPVDHTVCVFNKDGSPFNGKVTKHTIIIDPWASIADFANNAFLKYKNEFQGFFPLLRKNSEIGFFKPSGMQLNGLEKLSLTIDYKGLKFPEVKREFMQI